VAPSVIANEVRTLLRLRELRHPSIIRLLDVAAGGPFIVLRMEKADGNLWELQQVYHEALGSNIPLDHLLDLLDQAAEALDFLAEQPRPGIISHPAGMQHCDVKPSNLLLLNDKLRIADFGLCMSSLGGTHGKKMMGTPPYAAPELYRGEVTPHTDQFALAMTWIVLCTGDRALLPGPPAPNALPVDLKKLRATEGPVLGRALHPQWTQRFPNCKMFMTALREAIGRPRRAYVKKLGSRQLQRLRKPVGAAV